MSFPDRGEPKPRSRWLCWPKTKISRGELGRLVARGGRGLSRRPPDAPGRSCATCSRERSRIRANGSFRGTPEGGRFWKPVRARYCRPSRSRMQAGSLLPPMALSLAWGSISRQQQDSGYPGHCRTGFRLSRAKAGRAAWTRSILSDLDGREALAKARASLRPGHGSAGLYC